MLTPSVDRALREACSRSLERSCERRATAWRRRRRRFRARTLAFDPGGRRVFVITAKFGPTPAATPEHPRPRPPLVPGSFELLVLGE